MDKERQGISTYGTALLYQEKQFPVSQSNQRLEIVFEYFQALRESEICAIGGQIIIHSGQKPYFAGAAMASSRLSSAAAAS